MNHIKRVATCVSWRSEVPHFAPRWPHILAKPPATPRTVYTALQITGIFHNSSKSWVQYKNPEGQIQRKKYIFREKHFFRKSPVRNIFSEKWKESSSQLIKQRLITATKLITARRKILIRRNREFKLPRPPPTSPATAHVDWSPEEQHDRHHSMRSGDQEIRSHPPSHGPSLINFPLLWLIRSQLPSHKAEEEYN